MTYSNFIEKAKNITSNIDFNDLLPTANFLSEPLIGVTKALNNDASPGAVDLFMDSARGWGHRVEFGHSLDHLPEIYNKFGLDGLKDYFVHLSKDIMSPHGVPLPYTKQIGEFFNLSKTQMTDWMSFNIGNIAFGGLSIYNTYRNYQIINEAIASGNVLNKMLISKLLISSALKIYASIVTPNPIILACGIFDIGYLAYALVPVITGYLFPTQPSVSSILLKCSITCAASAGVITYLLNKNHPNLSEDELLELVFVNSVSGLAAGVTAGLISQVAPEPHIVSASAVSTFITVKYYLSNFIKKQTFILQNQPRKSPLSKLTLIREKSLAP